MPKLIKITLALAVAGYACTTAAAPPQAATPNFWAQWRTCEKGKGQARIEACTWLIASDRLNGVQRPLVHLYRGYEYLRAKAYYKAVTDHTEALKLRLSRPNMGVAYNNRGVAYNNLNRYAKAIADYDSAIKINPRYADAYNGRGAVYHNLKQYWKAVQDYDRAIEINPHDAAAYRNRGRAYYDLANYRQAIADFNKSIDLEPRNYDAHMSRGYAFLQLGNRKQYLDACENLLRLRPMERFALACKGFGLLALNRLDQALVVAGLLVSSHPHSIDGWYLRGRIFEARGLKAAARRDYHKALTLKPNANHIQKALKRLGEAP